METMEQSTHEDVEFEVEEELFSDYGDAFRYAAGLVSSDRPIEIRVLVYSEAGARWWGDEDAVEEFEELDTPILDTFELKLI